MGDTGMAKTPDPLGIPAGGLSDNEASGSDCDEGQMETDLIDFEEERDEHPDETVLDSDSEDEPGSGESNGNDQDKSAVKDNVEKSVAYKKKPLTAEKQAKGGACRSDGVAHDFVGFQSEKNHKLPPSAPAPRVKTTYAESSGGGGSTIRLSTTLSELPDGEPPTLPSWAVLATIHAVLVRFRKGTWAS
jgi:hypothetical protein